jgi:hypothetical protein
MLRPATPAPRERHRIQCEIGTPSFAEGHRVTAADFRHAPAWSARSRRQPQPTACSNEHDNTHRLLQSTQSPSTLANNRYPAPRRFSRRGVAPRGAPAVRCRTDHLNPEPAPCKARKPTLNPKWTSQSPAPALATLEGEERFRRRSRPTSGSPRERTNLW